MRRPSPALVIACLALGVALGGTSYATVLNVPRNSVGTPQLQRNAVKAAKIAPNAVRTGHVLDGTLLTADFKAGQIPQGPKGDKGDAGAPGATNVRVRTGWFPSPRTRQTAPSPTARLASVRRAEALCSRRSATKTRCSGAIPPWAQPLRLTPARCRPHGLLGSSIPTRPPPMTRPRSWCAPRPRDDGCLETRQRDSRRPAAPAGLLRSAPGSVHPTSLELALLDPRVARDAAQRRRPAARAG